MEVVSKFPIEPLQTNSGRLSRADWAYFHLLGPRQDLVRTQDLPNEEAAG